MTLLISEIIKNCALLSTKEEKVKYLREKRTPGLIEVFKYTFSPNAKFFCSDTPKYKIDYAPVGLSYSSLHNEYKRLYVFLEQTPAKRERKEQLLIQMLESVHQSDAELICEMIKKPKSLFGLTKKIVEEAFPDVNFN